MQTNWATNIPFQAANFYSPTSVTEVQELVHRASKVKVVGSGHCFNNIADTSGALISLSQLDKQVEIDHQKRTATFNPGMTYIELAPILHDAGYALHNMASLPHITVIGAVATATHGSGDKHGNLATAVSALEIVMANGQFVSLSRQKDGERFNGAVVALGALGIVTSITLDLVPTFTMQQEVYRHLPQDEMIAHFDEIMSSAYSVSLFTDWKDGMVNQLWRKHLLPSGEPLHVEPTFFGATLAEIDLHPLDGGDVDPITTQRCSPDVWYERLPHFHIRSKLEGGDELQTEYFVARQDAPAALHAVAKLQPHFESFIKLTEVRSMAADDLWLSMAYGRETVGIHFSWRNRWPEVSRVLPMIEEALAPFDARPHWGKLFTLDGEQIRSQYPKMMDFQALRREFDPSGKFSNAYLDRYLGSL